MNRKISFSMVGRVNKWLSFAAALLLPAIALHPLHLSTTEVNHNASEHSLEITCRIFADDFEAALSKMFSTKADFSDAAMKVKMDTLVSRYIRSKLQLGADDRPVVMSYLGFEKESDVVYVYLEVPRVARVKKLTASNAIMHDMFEDQSNIMHVTVNGNRQSTKLDYPTTSASFNF
ncbi:MAG TPA: DUF6702 family protein [Chitinophagaceae bacterium]|nr:DUF6702 family protein [Chitinophagaceae bacterium]